MAPRRHPPPPPPAAHLRAHRLLRRGAYASLAEHLRTVRASELLASERRLAGGTAVHVAAARAPSAVLRAVLRAAFPAGSERDSSAALDARDGESGWTALHAALYAGRPACALALIAAGASRGTLDADGRSTGDLYAHRWLSLGELHADVSGPAEAWAWGTNAAHQTGGARRSCVTPRAIGRCVAAATGHRHSLYVAPDGSLSAVGGGARGALGLGDEQPRGELTQVAGLRGRRIVAVAASACRSAALDENGTLYVWGAAPEDAPVLSPARVARSGRRGPRFVRVAVEDRFWVAVDDGGGLWGMGTNLAGELAMDETRELVDAPKKITAMAERPVVDVFVANGAPGRPVVGAITRDRALFVWGGAFGRSPRRVRFEKVGAMFGGGEPNEAVVSAAAGNGFIVIATENGRLYGLRPGDDGPPTATRIWRLMRRRPVSLAACANRFLVLDLFGECWSMEWEIDSDKPKCFLKVEGLRGVASMSLGKLHAVCIVRARTGTEHADKVAERSVDDSSSLLPASRRTSASMIGSTASKSSSTFEDDAFSPPSLTRICEDIMLKSLSLSNASELLLFAAETNIHRLRDVVLEFVRLNFDLLLSLHGLLDPLAKALAACEPDALDALLRGANSVEEENAAASAAGFSVWSDDATSESHEASLSAAMREICDACTEAAVDAPDVDTEKRDVMSKTGFCPFSLTASAASRKLRSLRKKLQSIQRIVDKVEAGNVIDDAARAKLLKRCCVERETEMLEKYITFELFAVSPTASPRPRARKTNSTDETGAPASFPPAGRGLDMPVQAGASRSNAPQVAVQDATPVAPVSVAASAVSSVAQAPAGAQPPFSIPPRPSATGMQSPFSPPEPASSPADAAGTPSRRPRTRARKVLTLGAMPSAIAVASSPVTPARAPGAGTSCPWSSSPVSAPLSLRPAPAPRAHAAPFSAILAEQVRESERERDRAPPVPVASTVPSACGTGGAWACSPPRRSPRGVQRHAAPFSSILAEQERESARQRERERALPAVGAPGAPAHMRAGRRPVSLAVPIPGPRSAPGSSWNFPGGSPGCGSPSLRDIQREEEHAARGRRPFAAIAAVPVGASGASPPRGWNRLPGDLMPRMQSIAEIEGEEREVRARGRGDR